MAELKTDVAELKTDVAELKKGQQELRADVEFLCESQKIFDERQKKLETMVVRMELELTAKFNVLADAREMQNDVNERILQSLDRIEDRLDRQERAFFS